MRKTVATLCLALLASSASASPIHGFYVGGQAGALADRAQRGDIDGYLRTDDPASWTTIDTNVIGGVHAGFDAVCGVTLLGVVADWNWTPIEHKVLVSQGTLNEGCVSNRLDWLTTIRARFGITINSAVVYLTAGGCLGAFKTTWNSSTAAVSKFSKEERRWGWTAGLGAEAVVFCNWSIGLEVLGVHYDTDTRSFPISTSSDVSFTQSDSIWMARALLNYRFSTRS